MSSVYSTQAFQQSRHARRIYIGGFPPNYGDEEALKFFLNSVIAKGLGEPNDNSYVLSIYVNQKKCFAFVELRAIELATACLDLDGIIYKKVVLKVLRANEYKPELIPPSMVGSPITLDLSSFSFGTPAPVSGNNNNEKANTSSPVSFTQQMNISKETVIDDQRLDAVIQFASLSYVTPGALTIIGYPFDDRGTLSFSQNSKDGNCHIATPASTTGAGSGGSSGLGCTQAAKKMRNMIRKYKFGLVQNPEYNIDLSHVRFVDIGDVQVGKTREETKGNLSSIVSEVVHKHAVPFIIGGSSECSYYTTQGILSSLYDHTAYINPEEGVVVGRVGMVVVSAQIEDTRILEDSRFLTGKHRNTTGSVLSMSAATASATTNVHATTNATSGSYSNNSSCASIINELDYQQFLQQLQQPSTEGSNTISTTTSTTAATCEGRYIRFAAQGSQCTSAQVNLVTQRGGHVVWLGRDIRNQSPQCSVLPSSEGSPSCSSSHAYTLKLFQDSLRCAAGIVSNTLPVAVSPLSPATVTTPAPVKVTGPELQRQDSAGATDYAISTVTVSAAVTEPKEITPVLPAVQQPTVGDSSPAPAVVTPEGSGMSAGEAQVSTDDKASTVTCKESTSTVTATTTAATTTVTTVTPSPAGSVVVSFDMGALSGAVKGCGYVTGSSCSATGLTVDEILDMAMIAGADPNVISLDISEFSPDAEDTRANMLLAQLFYHFSMGVAKRNISYPPISSITTSNTTTTNTTTSNSTVKQHNRQNHSVEVENLCGSFVLSHHTPVLSTLSTKNLPEHNSSNSSIKSADTALASSSRTPRFYHEVGSGSMDMLTAGVNGCNNSASTVGWDGGGGGGSNYRQHPSPMVAPHHQQPYIEVDHRLSSMDAMDLQPTATNATTTRRTPSPHVDMSTSTYFQGGNGETLLGGARTQYPSGVFTARTPTAIATESHGMMRVSPGNTPHLGSLPVRTSSLSANSPPLPVRSMNTAKISSAHLGVGSMYSGSDFPRSVVQNPQLHPQQQQLQYSTQGHLSSQQQQPGVVGMRSAQSYRRDVTPVQTQHQQQQYGGYHQQQLQQQQAGYPSQRGQVTQYQQQHGAPSSTANPYYDRNQIEQVGRYATAMHSQQQPPQQQMSTQSLRYSQQQQQRDDAYRYHTPGSEDLRATASSHQDYLGSEFLDITGERIPEQGGYMSGGYGRSGGSIPSSVSANALSSRSSKGLPMSDSVSVGSAGSLRDLHALDDPLNFLDYGLSRSDVPGHPQPLNASPQRRGMHAPTSHSHQQLQSGGDSTNGGDIYGEMMYAVGSGSSGDSLVYSQANCRSLSSDMMGNLPGGFELPAMSPLNSTGNGAAGGAGGGYSGNGFYTGTTSQQQQGQGICGTTSPLSTSSIASHSSRLQQLQ